MSELPSQKLPPGLRIRRGRYHFRFTIAGVEYTGSTGLRATERNLSAAISKMEAARVAVQTTGALPKLAPKPFSDAAAAFCSWREGECRAHPATALRTATSMESLKAFFLQTPLHLVTGGHIEDFKAWRRACRLKEVTIRKDLHALSLLFQYGSRHNWCFGNPVRTVKIPSDKDARREHVITPAEESVYFAAAARFPILHDVAKMVLYSGMRPAEVLALHRSDIDLKESLVTIRGGKTKAAKRTIALLPEAREVLERRMSSTIADRLFIGTRGGIQSLVNTLDGIHSRVLKLTKLAFTIYEFRHTFATRQALAGCPAFTLATILGHGDIRTISRYVHPSQKEAQEAMRHYAKRSEIGPRDPSESVESGTPQGSQNGPVDTGANVNQKKQLSED